jgi:4-hydroxybenzoate polyprenyltransferase
MKRVTNWPQAWLGLAMNWSFMPSYVSITNEVDVPLFFVMMVGFVWYVTFAIHRQSYSLTLGFSWTIHYDTIYACQDRKDDIKAGVKSTAVLFGDYVKPILSVFSSVVVAALAFAGYRVGLGYGYWSISVVFTAAHFAWQLITVDLDNGPDCWSKFAANVSRLLCDVP